MCFRSRKSHLCVICLLIYSVIPNPGHGMKLEGEINPVNHTEEQHLHQLDKDVDKYTSVTIDYFLDELMNKYGNGEIMSYEGFEHLLDKLNLADMVFMDHPVECHKPINSSDFISFHSSHNHSAHASESSNISCLRENLDDTSHEGHEHDDNEDGHVHENHEHGSSHTHNDDHMDSTLNKGHNHDDHEPADHPEYEHAEDQTKLNISADNVDDKTNNLDHEHDDHSGHDHSGHDHGDADHVDHDHGDADHSDHDHGDADHSDHDHGDADHSDHDHGDADNVDGSDTPHMKKRSVESSDKKCLPPLMMLSLVKSNRTQGLTRDMFIHLCPALIFQLESGSCLPCPGDHDHHHDHGHSDPSAVSYTGISAKVWGFSTIAVVIISLVGLLGVAVIPIVQKVFYNHLLQFLVALAVGALTGDALLHLLPHLMQAVVTTVLLLAIEKVFYNHLLQFLVALAVGALTGDALLHLLPHAIAGGHGGEGGDVEGHDHGSHGDGSHEHDLDPIYKGLCGLMGIYFFFLTERILTIFTDMKRRKKKKKNRRRYSPDDETEEKIGEKLANSDMECDEVMMSIHPNKDGSEKEVWLGNQEALKGYADEAHTEHCTISFANTSSINHQHGHRNHHSNDKVHVEEDVTIISHTSNGHGHGHGHSHCKDGVPSSVSAIAWMVIFGDGIHNFSDGLAIGAAFANSITGGFSTSIAVFCHELPHEIGDFAMLLRAGMKPKQAIIYNCVSSILCFIGMLIGVAIGNVQNASLWIFAIVGGMFLYIALVDMLPEMSSVDTKQGENPFFHLLLQLLGMLLGAGIMLLIAVYEDNLRNIFE